MKKALHIIGNILTAIIFLFALCVMIFTIISVNTVNKENDGIFGFKPYIVLSDSMSEVFQVGDMAISRQTDPATLQEGDIITFRSIDPAGYGQTVTHKIRQVTEYEGQRAFITYGTTTGADDLYPVPEANVLGKYVFHLPKMGYVFEFLRTPAGYVTIILIPFLLLLGIQAVKFFRLVRQYKQEQQADIAAQQEQLAAERQWAQEQVAAERQRMQDLMDELTRVKQQMRQQQKSQMTDEKTESANTAAPTGRIEIDRQTGPTENLQQTVSSQSQKMIEQIEKLKQQYNQENQQGDGR